MNECTRNARSLERADGRGKPRLFACSGTGNGPGAAAGRHVSHVRGNAAHALQQMIGNRGQLLRGDAERRPGDADRGDRQSLRVQHWNGDAAQAFLQLLIVDGIAAAARFFELCAPNSKKRIAAATRSTTRNWKKVCAASLCRCWTRSGCR